MDADTNTTVETLDEYYAGMTPAHRKREEQYLAFQLTQHGHEPEALEELAMHIAAIQRVSSAE